MFTIEIEPDRYWTCSRSDEKTVNGNRLDDDDDDDDEADGYSRSEVQQLSSRHRVLFPLSLTPTALQPNVTSLLLPLGCLLCNGADVRHCC